MRFHFSLKEVLDLVVSAVILSIAFWIFWDGVVSVLEIVLGITSGFLLHELAHKLVAQSMRYDAHYHIWKMGSVIAIVSSLLGFIFAAPGAVQIGPRIDLYGRSFVKKKEIGLIGLAGPLTNVLVAIVFILVGQYYALFKNAVFINLFIAGFNMIPFLPFDGHKVKEWSWWMWGGTVLLIISIALVASKLI